MNIIYAILVLAILVLAYRCLKNRKKYRLPPGPWQLPVLGYLPWIDAERPHESLTKLARTYGPICGLRMGSVYTILLSDPRMIRQAFSKDVFAGRAPLYLTHGIMQGYGLICAEGELWKNQRKFVASCLRNFGMIKYGPKKEKMEKRILNSVNECVSKLEEQSIIESFDPLEVLHHCVGNLMNDIVFGKVYAENDRVWKMLRHLQEEGVKKIGIAGPLNFLPFLRFLPWYGETLRFLVEGQSQTHNIYRKLLEEHRAKLAKSANPEDLKIVESFLAIFNEEMKNANDIGYFTEPQFCHLLADLYGAGTDTTLTTLRWFLLFMVAHPEEQQIIQNEMDRSLKDHRGPSLEDRDVLPRLEAALAEIQRLRSVVPVGIPHGTTEDTRIDDYDVPKGTMVVPLQWAVHTDPAYWHEPLEFHPERFIAEDGSVLRPEAFLPFQIGKRVCVGEELARMILFLFAGRILHTFVVSAPPSTSIDLEGECGITLTPKPNRLTFARRR